MAFTKGEMLRHCIAFALRGLRLNHRRLRLTEDDRARISDYTLRELRKHGAWSDLDDVIGGGPRIISKTGARQKIRPVLAKDLLM